MKRQVSRRAMLRTIAGGGLALTALPLLAACGDDDQEPTNDDGSGNMNPTEEPEDEETEEPTEEATETETETETAVETEETETEEPADDDETTGSLTIYSGRNENLVGPIIERFMEDTGINVEVRYGGTAELAAAILEEGSNTPADIFFAQDAGALGALAREGRLQALSSDIIDPVDARFRSPDDVWVGVTGRARTVVYNVEAVSEEEIPASILDFTDPAWDGRLGWAPTNGSFQAFVTALRVIEGEEVARDWLQGLIDNNISNYENNTSIVNATIDGEIDAGFVNHYYLYRLRAEAGSDLGAENYFYRDGGPGALINIAGLGILDEAENVEQAEELVSYLLSQDAQEYFANETFEYPLVAGVEPYESVPPIEDIQTPDIDLSDLEDLEGTLALLTEVGLI